jgi:hypothetical protein
MSSRSSPPCRRSRSGREATGTSLFLWGLLLLGDALDLGGLAGNADIRAGGFALRAAATGAAAIRPTQTGEIERTIVVDVRRSGGTGSGRRRCRRRRVLRGGGDGVEPCNGHDGASSHACTMRSQAEVKPYHVSSRRVTKPSDQRVNAPITRKAPPISTTASRIAVCTCTGMRSTNALARNAPGNAMRPMSRAKART